MSVSTILSAVTLFPNTVHSQLLGLRLQHVSGDTIQLVTARNPHCCPRGVTPGGTEAQEVLTQVPLLGGAAPKGPAHGCWILWHPSA